MLRQRPVQAVIVAGAVVLAVAAVALATSSGGTGKKTNKPASSGSAPAETVSRDTVSTEPISVNLTPSSAGQAPSIGPATTPAVDPSRSVVRIEMYSRDRLCSTGSGTVYPSNGYIITNEHVVNGTNGCNVIKILRPSDDQSGLLSLGDGEVLGVDASSDLAVIQLVELRSGDSLLALARATEPRLGDTVRVWAFPSIGTNTVTVTEGLVSGKASSSGGSMVWKTDAVLSGGSSGGAVVSEKGQLLGIVSQLSSSESGEVVDCRRVTDANGDGTIDESDTCVSVGGSVGLFVGVEYIDQLLDRLGIYRP